MDEVAPSLVCHGCVGDPYLKNQIRDEGTRNKCSFCKKLRVSVPLANVADAFHERFIKLCHRDDETPGGNPPQFWIGEFLGTEEDSLINAVHNYLWRTYSDWDDDGPAIEYGDDVPFRLADYQSGTYTKKWEGFRESLLQESRYFNPTAKPILDEIFDGLDFNLEHREPHPFMEGGSVVTRIGPTHATTKLYRAREARTSKVVVEYLKDPAKSLGPPPPERARTGRMNPAGISMFYGALEPETCVSEIRAPVGTYVVTGEFEVLRELRLLDFQKLRRATESIPFFHPQFDEKQDRDQFLEVFCFEIATPVHPQDEAFGYLPTQAVAEYLAQREDLKLDGLMFPSTQTGAEGTNVVLFRSASNVAPSSKLFEASAYDFGYATPAHFEVKARVPEPEKPKEPEDDFFSFAEAIKPPSPPPTLKINPDTIAVTLVASVNFNLRKTNLHDAEEENDF